MLLLFSARVADHVFGLQLFIRFALRAFREQLSLCVILSFLLFFWDGMWDLIVLIPEHCLSFYFLQKLQLNKANYSNVELYVWI